MTEQSGIPSSAAQLLEQVFGVIEAAGESGLTCDEVEVATGSLHTTASARIRELISAQRLRDSGRTRPTREGRESTVWVTAVVPTEPQKQAAKQPSLFLPSAIDPRGNDGLLPLKKRCLECVKCDLAKTRTNVVFGEGNADSPLVAFVGEAPGATEDRTGRPFCGSAGQKLTQMIQAMGLKREDVYICNAVNCRPPENRPPEKHELKACYEYLLGQLRAVKPKTIVALGASSVHALIGGSKKIGELRGKWLEWEGLPVMPTYHPSYLLRIEYQADGKEIKKMAWGDLQMVMHKVGLRTS
jgi:uracil-DNA glycosylase family 4